MEVLIKSRTSMIKDYLIYQGDSKTEVLHIYCDRYYNGKDLSYLDGRLKIRYENDSYNVLWLYKAGVTDDEIIFYTDIDINLTAYAGKVVCQPMLATDDNLEIYNCSVFEINVKESINAYEALELQVTPSSIMSLEAKLDNIISNFAIDEKPTENSDKLVTSGGVYSKIEEVYKHISQLFAELDDALGDIMGE